MRRIGLYIMGKLFSRRRAARALAGDSSKKVKKTKKVSKKKSK